MLDRNILLTTTVACDRAQELVSASQRLCRESRFLIDASKQVVGDLDDFLAEFSDQEPQEG